MTAKAETGWLEVTEGQYGVVTAKAETGWLEVTEGQYGVVTAKAKTVTNGDCPVPR